MGKRLIFSFILFSVVFLLYGQRLDYYMESLKNRSSLEYSDLNFYKMWASDTAGMFNIVKKSLNDPMYVVNRIDTTDMELLSSPLFYTGDTFSISGDIEFAIDTLKKLIEYVRGSFSEKEKKILGFYASVFWEEDSLDSLKGMFYKDRGYSMDVGDIDDSLIYNLIKRVPFRIYEEIYAWGKYISDSVKCASYDRLKKIDGIKFGGEGNDIYKEYPLILVEKGGDDIYYNPSSVFITDTIPFHIIIDKKGNDSYIGNIGISVASSFMGFASIYDMEGNDRYVSSHYGIACSIMGSSIINDICGDDVYKGGINSVCAATCGISSIEDDNGNDIYSNFTTGEGFGGPLGIGVLYDKNGDDTYRSGIGYKHKPLLPYDNISLSQGFGMGFRPDMPGGIGVLLDNSGNDFYNCSVFGQGASYWYSLGILIDNEGQDIYSGVEYCQGAGIHLSTGILMDKKGDDAYYVRLGPSQGEGHDLSVGIMFDREGNDFYYTSGGQGIGLTNSVGIFINGEGDDYYAVKEKNGTFGQGVVTEARGFWGYGIFIDGEGKDFYVSDDKEDSLFLRDKYGSGLFYDFPLDTPDTKLAVIDTIPDKELSMPVDSLFDQASLWEVGDAKEKVRRARSAMKKRYGEVWDYIMREKLDTDKGLEIRAIEEFVKYHKDSVIEDIRSIAISDTNISRRINAIYFCGALHDTVGIKELIKSLYDKEEDIRIKRSVIYALYNTPIENSDSILLEYVKPIYDEKTRIYSFRSLVKNIKKEDIGIVSSYILSDISSIRHAAVRVLKAYPDISTNYLVNMYTQKDSNKDYIKEALYYLLRNSSNMSYYNVERIKSILKDQ